ncbi:uncharacterized protein LOC118379217 isoform X2 [Oncorhynchus keta]|uniref:uncharacterized protein LOC118379217 isoform X2 n=1 Tax=Oncorhynchus keta TaxID=8018 RepID=UPI00227CBCB5|nr:uncharacterized protein LOC118379217 isoform X2 [Oncorhynchus keta]
MPDLQRETLLEELEMEALPARPQSPLVLLSTGPCSNIEKHIDPAHDLRRLLQDRVIVDQAVTDSDTDLPLIKALTWRSSTKLQQLTHTLQDSDWAAFHLYDSGDSDDEEDERRRLLQLRRDERKKRQRQKMEALNGQKQEYVTGMWNVNTVLLGGLWKEPDLEEEEESPDEEITSPKQSRIEERECRRAVPTRPRRCVWRPTLRFGPGGEGMWKDH